MVLTDNIPRSFRRLNSKTSCVFFKTSTPSGAILYGLLLSVKGYNEVTKLLNYYDASVNSSHFLTVRFSFLNFFFFDVKRRVKFCEVKVSRGKRDWEDFSILILIGCDYDAKSKHLRFQ